jgi:hypothetical protein
MADIYQKQVGKKNWTIIPPELAENFLRNIGADFATLDERGYIDIPGQGKVAVKRLPNAGEARYYYTESADHGPVLQDNPFWDDKPGSLIVTPYDTKGGLGGLFKSWARSPAGIVTLAGFGAMAFFGAGAGAAGAGTAAGTEAAALYGAGGEFGAGAATYGAGAGAAAGTTAPGIAAELTAEQWAAGLTAEQIAGTAALPAASGAAIADTAVGAVAPAATPSASVPISSTTGTTTLLPGEVAASQSPGIINSMMNWAEANPLLTASILNIGGGVLKGMGDQKMQEERLQHEKDQTAQKFEDSKALEEWKRRFIQGGSFFDVKMPFAAPAQQRQLRRPDGTLVQRGIITNEMK